MALRLITPPTAEIVTLAEAKKQTHTEYHTDDDTYLQALIATAVANIDGPEGWLGRAIREQEVELTIDRFPCLTEYGRPGRVRIPLPTLISVDEVEYTASDGTDVPLTGFRTFGVGNPYGGYILPAISDGWPSTLCDPGSVRITFTAGYGTVPASIKHAVLLLVSHWFENREAAADTKFEDLPFGVSSLLSPHRIF